MSTGDRSTLRRTISESRKSWWPGWIWGIPLAAVAIVVWLSVQALSSRGIGVTVVFDEAAGMKPGDTKVLYRGLVVGKVRSLELDADGLHVRARLDLDRNMAKFMNSGTRFYLQGATPSLSDLSSLSAIIAGPSLVLAPGAGAPTRSFFGLFGKPPQSLQVRLPYMSVFEGDAGDLKPGAAVRMRGFSVGEVTSVSLFVDTTRWVMATRVIFVLDPTRMHFGGTPPENGAWRKVLNGALEGFIQRGMRASLSQAPPLFGSHEMTLEIEPHSGAATLQMQGAYPEIPAAPPAGLDVLLTQAGEIPLKDIGDSVRAVTAQLETLVSSKELHDSIVRLDSTLAELDRTMHAVGPKLSPAIDSASTAIEGLRKAALQIDATAAAARRTIGAHGAQPSENVQDALRELTEAARAARSLANELDQHPESLIRGRR